MEAPVGVVSRTVARATVAPEGSVTCPRKPLVAVCADHATGVVIATARSSTSTNTWASRAFIRAPRRYLQFTALRAGATESRSAGIATGCCAKTPRREKGRLPVRRGLQNRLDSSKQGDGGYSRRIRSFGGDNHDGIAFLQFSERGRRLRGD